MYCPYPDCDVKAGGTSFVVGSGGCGCDYAQPVTACAQCGMVNRIGAQYCRRCRGGLEEVTLRAGELEASAVDFLSLQGKFRRPPVVVNGMLYALATDGALHRISPKSGARSKIVGEIGARGAGLNRGAAARVLVEGSSVHGWVYLAASRDGIAAISLATGATALLDEARGGQEISANRTEAEATGFRGVAAGDDYYAFATATEDGDFVLTIKGFSQERPALRPLAVHGERLVGPVLHDGLAVMYTEEEAGIYDVAHRVEMKMPMPPGFKPLLRPSSVELSVAPGSIPAVGMRGRDGSLQAMLAGYQDGAAGTMVLDFARKDGEFQRRPAGSSFYSNADGSLTISALDRMERVGRDSSVEKVRSLEAGMPACADGDLRLWFAEQEYRGNHRVMMMRGTQTMDVAFNDAKCTKDNCCGIYFIGADAVIAYLSDGSGDGVGMRLARWSLK